jgi:hypothetical protein
MVKRASLLLALAPFLLLAGCGFFTASLFPGYLAQTDKSFDLGSKIDGFLASLGSTDYRWYSQVFVLTTGTGADYGGVLIEIDSLPAKLLLMADAAGNLQQLPDPAGSFGRLRLRDAAGEFVVGQWHFAPGMLPSALYSGGVSPDVLGFSAGTLNYLVFSSDGLNITYQEYTLAWASGPANPVVVDTSGNYNLQRAYYDPLGIAGREVALVFFDSMYNRVRVFFTPLTGYVGATLASLTAYPFLDFNDVDASNVIYTRKGIVLADFDGNAVLKDFNGNDTGKSLDLGQSGEARVAFDVEGDTFYVFSPEKQMLYQGNTGW